MRRPTERPSDRSDSEPILDEASSAEVGRQLALAQEHLRGLHVEPRQDCWRCASEAHRGRGE